MTVPLLENADLIQYETDIEEDEIALEDPRVYTLSLQATSSILPLVSGGLVRATQYFPTLQLTVIDDAGEFGHVGVAGGGGGGGEEECMAQDEVLFLGTRYKWWFGCSFV